jgi:hypothetical protein
LHRKADSAVVEYLQSENDVARCCYKLLNSVLFSAHKDYIRQQIIHTFLQVSLRLLQAGFIILTILRKEESPASLHVLGSFLLYDGKGEEESLRLLEEENGFSRLLELLNDDMSSDPMLHRLFLDLMYETSRIQRIRMEELSV